MNKNLFIALLSSSLLLAGCGGNETSSSSSSELSKVTSEDTSVATSSVEPEDDVTKQIKAIKESHNYTLDVRSYLASRPDDVFTDTYVNIDDKAYYNTYFSGYSGIIYQKDQGYVSYIQAGEDIYPSSFYATNAQVGVSSLYDLVAENLFMVEYDKVEDGYECSDEDVIAVASNFSGYISTSWFIAPEKIHLSSYEDGLSINYVFEVGYIDAESADPTFEEGMVEIKIHNIGSSKNVAVENYIENPTKVYETPSDWSNEDLEMTSSYYNGRSLPFIPNASFSYSLESVDSYDGVNLYFTDYACGDQVNAYASLLLNEGYVQISEGTYRLLEEDEMANRITTYLVEMAYIDPSTPDGMHTIGFYYPDGLFQIKFSSRTKSKSVTTVDEFNQYIADIGLSQMLPPLPFGDEASRISGFDDRTSNMNQLYGNEYLFYTSSNFMKVYIDTYEEAVADLDRYISLLRAYGYDGVPEYGMGTISISNRSWNDYKQSFVTMTNLADSSPSSYQGYVMFRFCVYKPDHFTPSLTDPIQIQVGSAENLKSYEIFDAKGNACDSYDPTKDKGYFYASFETESGYRVKSVHVAEDPDAICRFDPKSGRFEIRPSAFDVSSYTLVPLIIEGGYAVSVDDNMAGASVTLTSPLQLDDIAEGDAVRFNVALEEGYQLDDVYLKENPDYPIAYHEEDGDYSFLMPGYDVTICVNASPIEEKLYLSSVEVSPTKVTFTVGDEFSFEGTVTAYYTNGTSEDVTSSATFFGYDMSVSGQQQVTVKYALPDGQFRIATYTIQVNPVSAITDVAGHSYELSKRLAGYDTTFTFTFNENGTGTYVRNPYGSGTSTIYFTYSQFGSSLSLTHASGSDPFSDFGSYRPFDDDAIGRVNATGVVNADGSISITLYSFNGSNPSTQTFSFVA